jgi:hypothetical protein
MTETANYHSTAQKDKSRAEAQGQACARAWQVLSSGFKLFKGLVHRHEKYT